VKKLQSSGEGPMMDVAMPLAQGNPPEFRETLIKVLNSSSH
jgi:hypothetical protein